MGIPLDVLCFAAARRYACRLTGGGESVASSSRTSSSSSISRLHSAGRDLRDPGPRGSETQ
jgi:hypothetical protein